MNQASTKTYWKSPHNPGNPAPPQENGLAVDGPSATGLQLKGNPPLASESADGLWSLDRRRFLEAAGFSLSLATAAGCGRAPVVHALPFFKHPPGAVPDQLRYYGSTCAGCAAGCGLLAGTRDGRPLKMEGMPEHPLSQGGLCAVGQAQPLELYDSKRLHGPLKRGPLKRGPLKEDKQVPWTEIDLDIANQLGEIKEAGGAVRLVTNTVTSPTLRGAIADFLGQFKDARHITLDAVSSSAILDAHEKTHGSRLLPHYRIDRAKVIVSFGADFLGTWISPVEFTASWCKNRPPTETDPSMSYHVQLESRLSLTGSNADRRLVIAPSEQQRVLRLLADRLAQHAGQPESSSPPTGSPATAASVAGADLAEIAQRLWAARGQALVLCDSQDVNTQITVNRINHLLASYGKTLDIEHPSLQRQGNDREVAELVEELKHGQVAALLVAGTDLTYNLPGRQALADAIDKVRLVVSFAPRIDDFAAHAHYVCPDHHALESWGDAEPIHGLVSIVQPTIRPIYNTRSVLESLSNWSAPAAAQKHSVTQYDLVRDYWRKQIMAQQEQTDFSQFWDRAVHDGFVRLQRKPVTSQPFQDSRPPDSKRTAEPTPQTGLTLVLYQKIGMPDSQHAQNPWLLELPDPITKVTWDNYVSVSQALAQEQSLEDGDVVRIQIGGEKGNPEQASLELPVFIQPGQHTRTVAIALAYGCPGTDRFAKVGPQWLESRLTVEPGQTVGKNGAPLISITKDTLRYVRQSVTLEKTGRKQTLASTQEHHSIDVPAAVAPHGAERRGMIQETTLAAYALDPYAGSPEAHHPATSQPGQNPAAEPQPVRQQDSPQILPGKPSQDLPREAQLWPEDHPMEGHWWGMMIDLNACTGCSACVIACQSENNVPVVGKDEVRRQREMHWLRLDRYYSTPPESASKEPNAVENDAGRGGTDQNGTDMEVYHQPMMCHHCDNAPCETVCPVLATVHGDEGLNEQAYNRCVGTRYCANNCPYKVRRFNWFKYTHDDTLQNLVLNPEVTVRSRGVMEKCSMCVQRIEAGKIAARRRGKPLTDGQIQTACQQSCPTRAIVFGDMNDPDSQVSTAIRNPRRYRVLEELNIRPSVGYLRMVKNTNSVAITESPMENTVEENQEESPHG